MERIKLRHTISLVHRGQTIDVDELYGWWDHEAVDPMPRPEGDKTAPFRVRFLVKDDQQIRLNRPRTVRFDPDLVVEQQEM